MGTKLPTILNCSSYVALVVFLSLTSVVTLAYPTTLESVTVNIDVFPRGNEHAKDRGQFKGFRISVSSNDDIAVASVRYNVNNLAKGNSDKFPLTKNGDGGWSYEDMSKILKKGDMLYWQLTYIINGQARVQHDVFHIGSQHGGHKQRQRRQLTFDSETDSTESTDLSDIIRMSSDKESQDINNIFGGGGYDGGSKRRYFRDLNCLRLWLGAFGFDVQSITSQEEETTTTPITAYPDIDIRFGFGQ